MRALRTSLVASILAFSVAPTSRADEPIPALEKAERLEAEGRSMIEHGHKAEGANAVSKAWRIRAEVWGSEQKMAAGDARPELAALKERIAATKAASNEAEKAGHALKEAGKVEDAQAKMEESGRLWREAEEMQKKLERAATEMREKGGADGASRDGADAREARVRELKLQAARARDEAEGAAKDAARADADGKEEAAAAARERAERLKKRVHDLEMAIRDAAGAPNAGPDRGPGLEGEVKALRQQMNEMRAMLDDLRKRLDDQPK